MSNPTLGTIACPDCGGLADVAQTKRGKGRYLYTRCANCGPDQRAGAAVQTRLWNKTDWREGMKPTSPPPNVIDTPVVQAKAEPKRELDDYDPATEPEPIDRAEKPGSGLFKVLGVLGGLGLVAVAAMKGA